MSGDDTHRGDTKGPEDRVTEGLVPSWKRERAGAGAKPPSRKWLPGTRQERDGLLPAHGCREETVAGYVFCHWHLR